MNEERIGTWKEYAVTIVLLIMNVAAYILCTQMGEVVYNVGSMNVHDIIIGKQYYRLISSMFLHWDIEHIVSNMIFLVGLGQMIEPAIGHVRYGILYMLSGLGGSILSAAYSLLTQDYYNAAGASGAIFGLIGALFILVLIGRGNYKGVTMNRMIFAVVYMIYSGVRGDYIDNWAHIGGLVSGVVIMAVMHVTMQFKRKRF